jgi:hypothetical protein
MSQPSSETGPTAVRGVALSLSPPSKRSGCPGLLLPANRHVPAANSFARLCRREQALSPLKGFLRWRGGSDRLPREVARTKEQER